MPGTPPHTAWAVAGLLLNAFVWGLSWWPFKRLEVLGLHPLWATAVVYGLSFVAIALWVWQRRIHTGWRSHPALWWLLIASGLTNVGFNWAVTVGDVVRVVLLFYLMPAWSVLVAWWLLGERPTAGALLRLVLALAGLVVIWDATRIGAATSSNDPVGPKALPFLIGAALIVVAGLFIGMVIGLLIGGRVVGVVTVPPRDDPRDSVLPKSSQVNPSPTPVPLGGGTDTSTPAPSGSSSAKPSPSPSATPAPTNETAATVLPPKKKKKPSASPSPSARPLPCSTWGSCSIAFRASSRAASASASRWAARSCASRRRS